MIRSGLASDFGSAVALWPTHPDLAVEPLLETGQLVVFVALDCLTDRVRQVRGQVDADPTTLSSREHCRRAYVLVMVIPDLHG